MTAITIVSAAIMLAFVIDSATDRIVKAIEYLATVVRFR